MTTFSKSQQLAMDAFEMGKSFFLTGKAGTGKSFVTRSIIERCKDTGKQVLVCAPTGIAAINVGGVTIHSAFAAPVGVINPGARCKNGKKIEVLQAADVILIDEISMCRLDLFEFVLNSIATLSGEKQIIMVGDFFQLPPILSDSEEEAYKSVYNSVYPFHSQLWDFATIELKEVIRTSDRKLIKALDDLRVGIPNFDIFKESKRRDKKAICLCTTNKRAGEINMLEMKQLEEPKLFKARIMGNYPEKDQPTDKELRLSVGARVIMLNNSDFWVNGSLGTVQEIVDDETISILLDSDTQVNVQRNTWEYCEYVTTVNEYGKKEIKQETVGTFMQFPVKLAWAITVHKSQGQTYDKVNVFAERFFCDGQMYVALSRCKTLKGMKIIGKISEKGLMCSAEVKEFMATTKIIKSVKRGGHRTGAGRKARFEGMAMKNIRVPAEFEQQIFDYIDTLISKQNQ